MRTVQPEQGRKGYQTALTVALIIQTNSRFTNYPNAIERKLILRHIKTY